MSEPIKPPNAPAAYGTPVVTTSTAPATMAAFTKEQEAYVQQLVQTASLTILQTIVPLLGQQNAATPKRNHVALEQCIVCRQARNACKDKHTKMVVFPVKYPDYAAYFMGVKINGVPYLSYDENYEIDVPTCCVSTITNAISAFEQNEKTVHQKRNKTHDSGSIGNGNNGKGFVKAEMAWR